MCVLSHTPLLYYIKRVSIKHQMDENNLWMFYCPHPKRAAVIRSVCVCQHILPLQHNWSLTHTKSLLFHLCCLLPLCFLHKTETLHLKKNTKSELTCPCVSSCSGWEEACCHGKPHLTSCLVWSCLTWVGGYISSSTWEQTSSDWHQVITTIISNKSKSQLWIKHSSRRTGHL